MEGQVPQAKLLFSFFDFPPAKYDEPQKIDYLDFPRGGCFWSAIYFLPPKVTDNIPVHPLAAATGSSGPPSPAQKAQQDSDPHPLSLAGTDTDGDTIAATVAQVDQKSGATDSAPPSSDVPETVITAVDGSITDAGTSGTALLDTLHSDAADSSLSTGSVLRKRLLPGYEQVFAGTGTGPTDRDGSIQGTAYLTYTVVSNATYNVDACLAFCSGVSGCGKSTIS